MQKTKVVLVFVTFVLVLAACGPVGEAEETVSVRYAVTHTYQDGNISLTYENASGNTEQLETQLDNGRWARSFETAPGEFLYVSVQNLDDDGTVTCQIFVDGDELEQARSTGGFTIATCSGQAPD